MKTLNMRVPLRLSYRVISVKIHLDSEFDENKIKWFSKITREEVNSTLWLRFPVQVQYFDTSSSRTNLHQAKSDLSHI